MALCIDIQSFLQTSTHNMLHVHDTEIFEWEFPKIPMWTRFRQKDLPPESRTDNDLTFPNMSEPGAEEEESPDIELGRKFFQTHRNRIFALEYILVRD